MDPQVHTTFIPKQTLPPSPMRSPLEVTSPRISRSTSILSVLAMLALFAAIISVGCSYLYEHSLQARINQMQQQLTASEKQFEPAFLEELHTLDRRLTYAYQVLRSHRSVAPLFFVLQNITLKSIQYDDFRFDYKDEQGVVQIVGQARSYQAIAQQSEVFSKERLIREHVFSDFTLQENGRINFNLVITLSPELLLFEQSFPLFNTPQNNANPS